MAKCNKPAVSFLFLLFFAGFANLALSTDAQAAGPVLNSIVLSDSDSGSTIYTNNSSVSVSINLTSGTPTHIMISKYSDFHDANWVTYASPKTFAFEVPTMNGPRTVYCKVKNSSSEESNIAQDSINVDTYRPSISTANSGPVNTTHVDIMFSDYIMVGADNPANYTITNGATVLAAQLIGPPVISLYKYRLATSPQTPGVQYTVTASTSLQDPAGNLIETNGRTFTYTAVSTTDTISPQVNSFSIDDPDGYTKIRDVSVSMTESGTGGLVKKWLITNTMSTPSGSAFTLTTRPTTYTLSEGDGTKTLYAWVMDDSGNISSYNPFNGVYSIILDQTLPIANAGSDQMTDIGIQVNFDGSGSSDNYQIIRYVWDFGDSSPTAEGVTATHTYTSPNTYTVTLTVYDGAGSTSTGTLIVTVGEAPPQDMTPPVANAGPDKSEQVGIQVNFDGSASTDNVGITQYVWNFGDGSPTVEGVTAGHAYTAPNVYTVTLTVYDAADNSDSDTAQVTITESPGSNYLEVGGPSPDYNTITDAMAHIAEGGTIYVYAGVYPEIVHLENNVTLKGDNNETVIIKGQVVAEEVSGTIENLSILYREGTMLSFNNANYIDLKLMADAGITAVNSPLTIKKCIIKPDLEYINYEGGYDPPLEYYGKAIQIWNMYGTDSMAPQIESNLIQNTDCGIYYFSQAFGGAILGNIKNNTFYHNKDGVILRMHKENPHIYNNIFDNSEDAAIFLTYEDGDLFNQRKLKINNNLFNQNTQSFSLDGNDRSDLIIGIQYNIQDDPEFVDPLNSNFYLESTSPALTAGEGGTLIGAYAEFISQLFIDITSPQDGSIIYAKP